MRMRIFLDVSKRVKTDAMGSTDHSDEQPGLLCGASNASITYNTNGKACGKAGKPNGKTCAKLDEAGVERHVGRD